MKRVTQILLLLLLAVGLSSCFGPLATTLPTDVVITLGYHAPSDTSIAPAELRGGIGGTLQVPVQISLVAGSGLGGSYDVTFVLSQDADLETEADNEPAQTVTVSSDGVQIVELSVDAGVLAGLYTLFATLTATDAAANNNTASIPVQIGANDPDLTLSINPLGMIVPGGEMQVTAEIQNEGFASLAAESSVGLVFRMNIDGTDVDFLTPTVTFEQPLHPLSVLRLTFAVPMPTIAQMAADDSVAEEDLGYWQDPLTGIIDEADDIAETNDGNNTDSVNVIYQPAKPNLEAFGFQVEESVGYAKQGTAAEGQLTLRNSGGAAATSYALEIYVDVDGSGDKNAGDEVVKTFSEEELPIVAYDLDGELPVNNEVTIVFEDGMWPTELTDGSYDVLAEATITGDYDSGDDIDSVSVDLRENVYDLEITAMSTSFQSAIVSADGGDVPLTVTVTNRGEDAVTTDFSVQFWSTDDTLLVLGDQDLGSTTVTETVPAGGSVVFEHTASFPTALGNGYYTVWWELDDGDAVAEVDESNNDTGSVNNAFVFVLIDDDSGVYGGGGRVIVYTPTNVREDAATERISIYFYGGGWFLWDSDTNAQATGPADLYDYAEGELTTGATQGILIHSYNAANEAPYVFRIVPDYVGGVNMYAIPSGILVEDDYEENDSQGEPAALGLAENPLYGWVAGFADGYAWPEYEFDYFTFAVPDVTP